MDGVFRVSPSAARRMAARPGAMSDVHHPAHKPATVQQYAPTHHQVASHPHPQVQHVQSHPHLQPQTHPQQQHQPQPQVVQQVQQPDPQLEAVEAMQPVQYTRVPRRRARHGHVGVWIAATAGFVILVGVIAGGFLWVSRPQAATDTAINPNEYQAVFFTSGQACLGKLQPVDTAYMRLTNVFCLQKQADVATAKADATAKAGEASNIQLTNLANDALGPHDEMIIARNQILFYENLKPDGKAAKAIQSYGTQN